QNLQKDLYQVIIVNNNSKDTTQQLAEKYIQNNSNFSLINEKKQGLSHARNKGWKKAKGKYVAYIDDDARATLNWCKNIIDAFENVVPKPIAVGGPIYPLYEKKPPKWFPNEIEIRNWGDKPHFLKGDMIKWGFSGSNMAFPRSILKKYRGFSTEYGRIGNELRLGEDTELFHRISKKEPFFWYDPQIKVFHWVPVNKMNLRYIMLRSYKGGQNIVLIENLNITLINYMRNWVGLLLFLFQIPYLVIKSQKNKKMNHVRLIKQLCSRLGSLKKQTQLILR
ncbi:MAG: glycosyltransferase, partial [Candidatus Hodarchaeota archaeon]